MSYKFSWNYPIGKVNAVPDELSRKSLHMSILMVRELELIEQFRDLCLVCDLTQQSVRWGILKANNDFLVNFRESQKLDVKLVVSMIASNQSAHRKCDAT